MNYEKLFVVLDGKSEDSLQVLEDRVSVDPDLRNTIDTIEALAWRFYHMLIGLGVREEDARQILSMTDMAEEVSAHTFTALLNELYASTDNSQSMERTQCPPVRKDNEKGEDAFLG